MSIVHPSRRLKQAPTAIVAFAALAITARFIYEISQIEAGWSTAVARWHTATFRRLTSASEFVSLREPPEQADYWLAEVDRIVSGPGDAARLAMGAASILDAPAQGYVATRLGPAVFPGLQKLAFAGIERAEAVFESRCRAKCLELAKRATDLQPANVNWWRMRAMLTFGLAIDGTREQVPRTGEWQTVLAEAASHDPDNALYDYLAAIHLWRASSDDHVAPPAGGLMFVGFLLWRARFRFTLRAAFIMVFVCAVLCVPLAALHEEGALDDLSASLRILPVGVGAWDAATLQNRLGIAPHSWVSATWQWFLRSGYFYSAVASPLLVALWWGVRRASATPGQSPGGSRAWWAGLSRDAGRSALALAAILLLVDLVLAPRTLAEAEANYQQRMLFFRDPAKSQAVSQEAIAAVERDRATMAALRQTTDEEMADLLGQGDAPSESTGSR
jgi:hypothetical protein